MILVLDIHFTGLLHVRKQYFFYRLSEDLVGYDAHDFEVEAK